MRTGLKTLSSNWPFMFAMVMVEWLPMTWVQSMVKASHCVGFTFPGMMELPGSFSGSCSSPNPQRGPLPKYRMSCAILNRDVATVFKAPEHSTMASWAARASNLLGAVWKVWDVMRETSWAMASANPEKVLRPVPTAVPP